MLDVQKCYLLVSSRVLELFCQFFKTMLRSNAFMEGIEQPNVQHPPVKQVHEDHLDIFLLICRVLHYLPVRPPDCVEDYHLLADLCNFYGCSWALSFHVRAWMERWNFSNLPIDQLQTFLWVTFVFHLREKFQEVSLELAKAFTLQDWKAWDVHPMPLQLKGKDLQWRHLDLIPTEYLPRRHERALGSSQEQNTTADRMCHG